MPDPSRRCIHCKREVATPFCSHCGLNEAGHSLDLPVSPEVAGLLHRFNAGAGLGAGFWTFGNGAPVLGTIYWLNLLILPPISIGIMVYLFFNGNRVALSRRRFASIERFKNVQRAWAFAAVPLIIATLGVVAYALMLVGRFYVALLSS